jgi:hypothetical protein
LCHSDGARRPSEMKRSPLGRWPSVLGCSWKEDTMVRHDAGVPGQGFPGVHKLNKICQKESLGRILASVVCHHRQSFLEVVKKSPSQGTWAKWRLRLLLYYDPRQPSPPPFFPCQPQRDNVLFSALESFLEDFTTLWPFPRSLPDLTECLTTIIQDLSLESIKYHARVQSQITPN